MLITKDDGTQIHIPEEHLALDDWTSRWHARNMSRGIAVMIFVGAIIYFLGATIRGVTSAEQPRRTGYVLMIDGSAGYAIGVD
jgi:hypothetical protein